MLRKHENSVSWKAGILAIAVHVVLLVAMLVSFNWKSAHTVLNVTEVELWDKIPKSNPPVVQEEPKPEPPPPIVKEEPKPEPKIEEKPKPEEPKVDIELEKKKKELEKKEADEKLEKEKELEAKKKFAQKIRDEDLRDKTAAEKQEKLDREAIRKIQEEMLSENGADDAKASSAANAAEKNAYIAKITAKIRSNVNKSLCGDGSPEIHIEISVLPTGQISGNPKITKSSDNAACDEAVERATLASDPLPLPDDPDLKAQFRNLKLKFRPND